MPLFDWDADLTPEDRDALIEKMAQRVERYGLYTPAILFLELNKPIAFLSSQAIILGSGALGPLFGMQNVQQVSKLLESRDNVERLIRRIEELSVAEQTKRKASPRKG